MSRKDDQRMRELANRLVAMAPEPPPFPEEEVTLTTPSKSSRPRPLLVFAGAALLVLIGAAIPLLVFNNGTPGPVGTTSPTVTEPPVDTTEPAPTTEPTTATTQPTDTTEPPGATTTFQTSVYLVQDPENSFTGDPALVPFWTEVVGPESASVELLALQLLTSDELTMPAPEFYSMVADDVEIIAVSREEETLLVEVNEAFRAGTGGLLSDMTMLNQLVYTATQATPEVDLVRFLIDGQPIVDFGTDGLDISDGLTRETFLDSLNSVLVTQPVIFGGDGLPQVEGIANVFEATVSLQIVDADGEVVYDDFTTATCGGCWGEYVFALDTPALSADSTIRVFWNSPEDGSPTNVVEIPVTEDGVWDLVPGE